MQQKTLKKILSVLLALFMSLQNMHFIPMHAADNENTWTKIAWEDITSEDVIAVTMSKEGKTYVLPADTKTSQGITAVIGTISGTTLTTDTGNYGWNVSAVTEDILSKT
ncbi:MAG: hypothetical protein IIY75_08475, partial [Erysipelotrichales bacterium]|nr:hypothetical protein [Erysipelotrichales bacterium]